MTANKIAKYLLYFFNSHFNLAIFICKTMCYRLPKIKINLQKVHISMRKKSTKDDNL